MRPNSAIAASTAALHRCGIPHVGDGGNRALADLRDLVDQRLEFRRGSLRVGGIGELGAHVQRHDVGAGPGERERHRPTLTVSGAGDQSDPSGQFGVVRHPSALLSILALFGAGVARLAELVEHLVERHVGDRVEEVRGDHESGERDQDQREAWG